METCLMQSIVPTMLLTVLAPTNDAVQRFYEKEEYFFYRGTRT